LLEGAASLNSTCPGNLPEIATTWLTHGPMLRPMSRRRTNKTPFDEAADLFVQLPAKVGLITATGLFVLGWVLPVIFPSGSGFAGVYAQLGKNILWLFAAVVAVAALAGMGRRWMDRTRFESNVRLDDLTWREFEGYLAEFFRRRGSSVTYRGGAVADGGVDLLLDDARGRRIVQAKHWKVRRVGVDKLRELWGIREDERAVGAVLVTSGGFTPDALRFAEGKQLELIDGDQLVRLIAEVKGNTPRVPPAPLAAEMCPQCARGVLEKRLARRGANAGSHFLGCSGFPECRYTRSI
jgi:restriction system protein